jgi:hypothetical protein
MAKVPPKALHLTASMRPTDALRAAGAYRRGRSRQSQEAHATAWHRPADEGRLVIEEKQQKTTRVSVAALGEHAEHCHARRRLRSQAVAAYDSGAFARIEFAGAR